eukprot:PLAT15622.1.p1 GENE.PLAT15622.1~~PLAT15622.1.p1  ORF type:complete len:246 (+),score=138.66 PLAT15622.1:47-739(+)
MHLFGKAKRGPTTAETISKLRGTLDTLERRELHIQNKIKAALNDAKKKSAAKDKRGAIFCLKRKKMYEAEIEKIGGARMTLESQIMSLESATVNMETFKAMRAGAAAMKDVHGKMTVDKVDDMMEDISEEMAVADEISRAIAGPMMDVEDDDELLEELARMEEEDLEVTLMAAPSVPTTAVAAPAVAAPDVGLALPEVPTTALPSGVEISGGDVDEEEMAALRALEASMM